MDIIEDFLREAAKSKETFVKVLQAFQSWSVTVAVLSAEEDLQEQDVEEEDSDEEDLELEDSAQADSSEQD